MRTQKPININLIMTNMTKYLQNSQAIETGLFDFHKMCLIVLKVFYTKQKQYFIQYRSYCNFSNEAFINDLRNTFFQFSSSWENYLFFFKKNSKKLSTLALRNIHLWKKDMLERTGLPSLLKLLTKEFM